MGDIIILPGLGGSGEAHWQTAWERAHPEMRRFAPASWNKPELRDWVRALDHAIGCCGTPPLLVAHSLACLLIAHWHRASDTRIAGAFLVAVPDPEGTGFPEDAAEFVEPPAAPFDFPALIVASSNDPYGTLDHARRRAVQWGAGLVELGELGHVNGSSGLGDWQTGLDLLAAFKAGCGFRRVS